MSNQISLAQPRSVSRARASGRLFLEGELMKKLMGAMFLMAAMVLMASGTPNTLAQGKKGSKGTIELIESKDGKYRFSVRDADGKYVGGSAVGHATEKEAREAAEELKKVLATATYVSKKSEDSKKGKEKGKEKDND